MLYIRTKVKAFLMWLFFRPSINGAMISFFRGRIPSEGLVFDVNNPYIAQENAASIFWHDYQPDEIDHLRMYLRKDFDVIELGSGMGVVSTEIARLQEPSRKLVCIETNPYLIPTLETNIKLNFPNKNFTALNRVIDYSGQNEIDIYLTRNNLHTRVRRNTDSAAATPDSEIVKVPAATLSDIVKEHGYGRYILVADIEGAEAGILLEDAEALAMCDQIQIELHPVLHKEVLYSVEDLCKIIESLGFRRIAQRARVYVYMRD